MIEKCQQTPEAEFKQGSMVFILKLLYNLRKDMQALIKSYEEAMDEFKEMIQKSSRDWKKRMEEDLDYCKKAADIYQ